MASTRMRAFLFAALLLAAAGSAFAAAPAIELMYDSDEIEFEAVGRYSRPVMEGLRVIAPPGAPALPARVLTFVIPDGMRVVDVTVRAGREEELPGRHLVAPAQAEVPIGEEPVWTEPDASIYGGSDVYPSSRAEFLSQGSLGGYRLASVAVYPVVYRPSDGTLVLASDLTVELTLAPGGRGISRERMTRGGADLYARLVRDLVVNPESVSSSPTRSVVLQDVTGPEGFRPRYTPSLEGSPVEYVIVTTEAF